MDSLGDCQLVVDGECERAQPSHRPSYLYRHVVEHLLSFLGVADFFAATCVNRMWRDSAAKMKPRGDTHNRVFSNLMRLPMSYFRHIRRLGAITLTHAASFAIAFACPMLTELACAVTEFKCGDYAFPRTLQIVTIHVHGFTAHTPRPLHVFLAGLRHASATLTRFTLKLETIPDNTLEEFSDIDWKALFPESFPRLECIVFDVTTRRRDSMRLPKSIVELLTLTIKTLDRIYLVDSNLSPAVMQQLHECLVVGQQLHLLARINMRNTRLTPAHFPYLYPLFCHREWIECKMSDELPDLRWINHFPRCTAIDIIAQPTQWSLPMTRVIHDAHQLTRILGMTLSHPTLTVGDVLGVFGAMPQLQRFMLQECPMLRTLEGLAHAPIHTKNTLCRLSIRVCANLPESELVHVAGFLKLSALRVYALRDPIGQINIDRFSRPSTSLPALQTFVTTPWWL